MKEYIVGLAKDIPEGEGRIFEVGNRSIGVFNIKGNFYALRNQCPHQGGPVCNSRLFDLNAAEVTSNREIKEYVASEKSVIACPWHGFEFDVESGRCLTKKEWKLAQYNINVDSEGNLIIEM